MMSVHYNAFISYRHSKEDMNAAALVQRSLERFRIPAKIREKTGIKKIDRIFRDKEELPITSSLNDNISEALDHSDFLIVICSVSTKESYWVRREIQYFLKSHSKNKVLTVLVNGEPQDVIPEILRVDREMRIKPDGTEYVEEINRDPLSSDLRSGNRRSKRYEIMRLAAALLGCGYDELVMREKQYNRRRLSAVIGSVFISMLCALIYLKWSRDQIKENYQRSLENQSMYLSTEAENLLEEGARITAIQLAAAAHFPIMVNGRWSRKRKERLLRGSMYTLRLIQVSSTRYISLKPTDSWRILILALTNVIYVYLTHIPGYIFGML